MIISGRTKRNYQNQRNESILLKDSQSMHERLEAEYKRVSTIDGRHNKMKMQTVDIVLMCIRRNHFIT